MYIEHKYHYFIIIPPLSTAIAVETIYLEAFTSFLQKQFNGKMIFFSMDGAGITGNLFAKTNFNPHLISYTNTKVK